MMSDGGGRLEGRTDVVKAPWSQPLWEVGGKQEAGEEGEQEVVTVAGQAVARAAAPPTAQEDLQQTAFDQPISHTS